MILILGGTTEGRLAVKVADEAGKPFYYSTRSDLQQVESHNGVRLTGGMDRESMTEFCRQHDIRLLIDAAHPFAEMLHDTVADVSEELSIPVIRLERMFPERDKDIIWCRDYDHAVELLRSAGVNNLLALTGVKTISKLKGFWCDHSCRFRILDREESLEHARQQDFPQDRLVYYHQGESEDLILKELCPDAVITKESGLSGGFHEKVNAARRAGIPVYAVMRPEMPYSFETVTGEHTLRRAIEKHLPDYYPLKSGYTTGSCATAASKAALSALIMGEELSTVQIRIPNGELLTLCVDILEIGDGFARASVIKDAGDDPDVTNGCTVQSLVRISNEPGIHFLKGEGVGTITLPGLGLEIGEPAINPTPREMIRAELTELMAGAGRSGAGVDVTISVPGGEQLAEHTFNPKLGIVGGISIIGTSGIVRPFSSEAFVQAIRRECEVAKAVFPDRLVINSGARSERFVKAQYPDLPAQAYVHYGNYIGETLEIAQELGFPDVTMGIMIGKAVKLAEGNFDTHSRVVTMNREFIREMAVQAGVSEMILDSIDKMVLARELWDIIPQELLPGFCNVIKQHCHALCNPLLPGGKLTILLISESGQVY